MQAHSLGLLILGAIHSLIWSFSPLVASSQQLADKSIVVFDSGWIQCILLFTDFKNLVFDVCTKYFIVYIIIIIIIIISHFV
jgi:hypothetical protein